MLYASCRSERPSGRLYKILNPLISFLHYLWFMILIEYVVLFLVGYFFFRLISNVILPVMRTVRVVRREFQEQGQGGQDAQRRSNGNSQPGNGQPGQQKNSPNWDKMGDYIDFEEVK